MSSEIPLRGRLGRPRVSDAKTEKIIELYTKSDMTIHEIIEEVGCAVGTLYKVIRRENLKRFEGREPAPKAEPNAGDDQKIG